jgi:hypothetical protein
LDDVANKQELFEAIKYAAVNKYGLENATVNETQQN